MEPKEKKAFEPTGLVPRSIVRTFERFRQQLLPGSETAAIREYRISRYQVLVSARCLFALLTIPIVTNWLVSNWLLSPLIEHFWNTQQNEIFLNSYQEERAFAELEFFSEKLFFESLLNSISVNVDSIGSSVRRKDEVTKEYRLDTPSSVAAKGVLTESFSKSIEPTFIISPELSLEPENLNCDPCLLGMMQELCLSVPQRALTLSTSHPVGVKSVQGQYPFGVQINRVPLELEADKLGLSIEKGYFFEKTNTSYSTLSFASPQGAHKGVADYSCLEEVKNIVTNCATYPLLTSYPKNEAVTPLELEAAELVRLAGFDPFGLRNCIKNKNFFNGITNNLLKCHFLFQKAYEAENNSYYNELSTNAILALRSTEPIDFPPAAWQAQISYPYGVTTSLATLSLGFINPSSASSCEAAKGFAKLKTPLRKNNDVKNIKGVNVLQELQLPTLVTFSNIFNSAMPILYTSLSTSHPYGVKIINFVPQLPRVPEVSPFIFEPLPFTRKDISIDCYVQWARGLNDSVSSQHFTEIGDLDSLKIKERVQNKILELAIYYNQQTILSITNVIGDLISLFTLGVLFIWMKPEISILKSFLIEAIYSLSDTTKSFLLILLTDLLVGFHSPRGWETALELLLKHFGLPENQDFVFLFVATLPVILDTVFKYWIFRHLNKISPSTVATYHNMIE